MKLKEYLYKKRLTPQEFSDLSKISLATIYRLLKANRSSSMKIARTIAEITNNEVTIEELRELKNE